MGALAATVKGMCGAASKELCFSFKLGRDFIAAFAEMCLPVMICTECGYVRELVQSAISEWNYMVGFEIKFSILHCKSFGSTELAAPLGPVQRLRPHRRITLESVAGDSFPFGW